MEPVTTNIVLSLRIIKDELTGQISLIDVCSAISKAFALDKLWATCFITNVPKGAKLVSEVLVEWRGEIIPVSEAVTHYSAVPPLGIVSLSTIFTPPSETANILFRINGQILARTLLLRE